MCSSGCPTQDCPSYGYCLRNKGVKVAHQPLSATNAWDAELHAYQDAVNQGIQPAGTTMKKVKDAVRISNELGRPYNADARVEIVPE